MSEDLKRRLVGAGVLLFIFSMIAWWVGSRDDQSGELPAADAQIRNYDIRELDRIAAAQKGAQPEQEPVPDTTAEPQYSDKVETVASENTEAEVAPAPETVKEPEPVKKPAPVTKPVPEPKPAPKVEKKPEPSKRLTVVSSDKPNTDSKGQWVVQVSSVTQKSSADGLVQRLKSKGWDAFLTQAQVNGKNYYRVRVGPYVKRDSADTAAKMLKKELGQDVAVLSK